MRRFAVMLLTLVFAGAAGGVGCLAIGAALAATDSMACCTPQCPAPNAPRQPRSCAAQPCAPSADVAPASHATLTAPGALGWAASSGAAVAACAVLAPAPAASAHWHAPAPPDFAATIDRLCSRQI